MCLWAIYIFIWSISLFCCRKYVDQSWEYINRSQTHECGKLGLRPCNSFSGNTKIGFSLQCTINVGVILSTPYWQSINIRNHVPSSSPLCFGKPWAFGCRDFGLDYRIVAESFETSVPWDKVLSAFVTFVHYLWKQAVRFLSLLVSWGRSHGRGSFLYGGVNLFLSPFHLLSSSRDIAPPTIFLLWREMQSMVYIY